MKNTYYHKAIPLNHPRQKPLPALWTYAAAVLVSVIVVLAGVWVVIQLQP